MFFLHLTSPTATRSRFPVVLCTTSGPSMSMRQALLLFKSVYYHTNFFGLFQEASECELENLQQPGLRELLRLVGWPERRWVCGSYPICAGMCFDSVSLPVSGGESRFMFFRRTLRVILRRAFPCVGCSVVCGGIARGVHLWCVV